MISGVKLIFENYQQNEKNIASASVADSVQNIFEEPDIHAQSAISVWTDLSGQSDKVLFSKNEQRILSVASISKLMTALVVVENSDLSQKITISDKSANQSKDSEPLKAGETYFAKDLLYTMLIGSDNTASYALSESIGADKFVGLMNEKTKELGLSDTSFENPTGLGLENFSTAHDLAKLAEYLLKEHSSILAITTTPEFNLYSADGKIMHEIINTDKLLNDSSDLAERIIGGKTGDTRTAGKCLLLVVTSPDNQGYFINVILNSNDRFGEMKKLINRYAN